MPNTVPVAPPPAPAAIDHIINLEHPVLTPRDALMLDRLLKLRASYMSQGRGREAHAVARSALVVWHTVLKMAHTDHMAATMPAPLDIVLTN